MWQTILSKLGSIKVTLLQGLLIVAASALAVLAFLLRFKERELQDARVDLLEAHFDNEKQRQDAAIATSAAKVQTSKERYEAALDKLNALDKSRGTSRTNDGGSKGSS